MGNPNSEPQAVIFPHLYLPEAKLKKAAALFPRLFVPALHFIEQEEAGFNLPSVSRLYPSEDKRPRAELEKLVLDVQEWIERRGELGFRDFFKALLLSEQKEEDEKRWDITAMIKEGRVKKTVNASVDRATLYHFILYLFYELEKNQSTADSILDGLSRLPSPLEDALEEPDSKPDHHLSQPLSSESAPLDDEQLELIIKAWFWTFGGELSEPAILITFVPSIFHYVVDQFEESTSDSILSVKSLSISRVELPDLSRLSRDQLENILDEERLSRLAKIWEKAFAEAERGHGFSDIIKKIEEIYNEPDVEKTQTLITYFPEYETANNNPWPKELCGNLLVCFLNT